MPDVLRQRDVISYHLGQGLSLLGAAIRPSVIDGVDCTVGPAIDGTPAVAAPVNRDLAAGWAARTAIPVAAVDVRG